MIPESYLVALAEDLVASGRFDDRATALAAVRNWIVTEEEYVRQLSAPGKAKYREAVERIGSVFDQGPTDV